MTDQIWWYATRAAGLMTWATAMASITLGLVMSLTSARSPETRGSLSRWLRRTMPTAPWVLDVHRFVGALSVVFLAIHMITLWADSFVHFGWAELFIPFASGWRPLAVAFGVVSAWLLIGVEASSLLRKWLPPKVWHGIHLGSYVVAVFGTVHAVTAGSDVSNPFVAGVGLFMLALVVGLTVVRIVILRRPKSGITMDEREAMLLIAKAVSESQSNQPAAPARVPAAAAATSSPARAPRPTPDNPQKPPAPVHRVRPQPRPAPAAPSQDGGGETLADRLAQAAGSKN